MTTTFADLVDAVEAAFLEFTGGDTSVLFQRGKLALAENRQQRRMVFVRPGGTVSPSTRAGSSLLPDGTRARMVKRRAERVVVSLFAEGETAAEIMLDNLIAACEATLGTGFVPDDYEWLTEDTKASNLKYTEVIRLTAAWNKAVLDRPEPLTQLESQDHHCSFGDGDFDPADFLSSDFLTAGGEAA